MKARWALAVSVLVLLTGCNPPTPPTPAPPTPTFMCTPEAGGAEKPCSQGEFDKMKAKDAEYTEAEKVFREFQAETEQVLRKGGVDQLPARLVELVENKGLREQMLLDFKSFKLQGLRMVGPGIEIRSATRVPGRVLRDSTVSMEFCVDASANMAYKGKSKQFDLGVSMETFYFKSLPDRVVIVGGDTKVVKQCT